jgi:hypothetical protein
MRIHFMLWDTKVNLLCEGNNMLVTKSYFLSELERFKLEEMVLNANKGISEAEILKLDDRELKELAEKCKV